MSRYLGYSRAFQNKVIPKVFQSTDFPSTPSLSEELVLPAQPVDRCPVSAEMCWMDPNSRTQAEAGRLLNDPPAAAAMAGSDSLLLNGKHTLQL